MGSRAAAPEIRVLPDRVAAAREAAAELVACASRAIETRGGAAVAISGGATARPLYGALLDPAARLEWARVQVFWVDERPVPPDHPDSNFGAAYAAAFSKLPLPACNLHRIEAERSPEEAVARYDSRLRAHLPRDAAGVPVFDAVHLGVGPDGHTASWFPGSPLLEGERAIVAAAGAPGGSDRITLTPRVIDAAARVIVLVTGAEKAEIVRRVIEGPPEPAVLPAQAIRPRTGALIWVLDAGAAARLESLGSAARRP